MSVPRTLRISGLLALATVGACGGGADTFDITAVVRSGVCSGPADVDVSVLDTPRRSARTTDGGALFLRGVPADAQLLAVAPAHLPTISAPGDLGPNARDIELAIVPSDFGIAAVAAAGFAWGESSGVVVALVETDGRLPVGGVRVTLRDGASEPFSATRRYVSFVSDFPTFDASDTGTTDVSSIVAFFEIPPGEYVLDAADATGQPLAPRAVSVRGGHVTVARIVAARASDAELPVTHGFATAVAGTNARPTGGPLAGASVTVRRLGSDETWTGTTNHDGDYAIALPVLRHWISVEVEAEGYVAQSTGFRCFTGDRHDVLHIGTSLSVRNQNAAALDGAPSVPGTGAVRILVTDGRFTIDGATVHADDALGAPYYGEDTAAYSGCAHATCGPSDTCPEGRRCQDGECVLGTSGPLCTRAADDAPRCPSGSTPESYRSPLDTTERSYCLPVVAACTDANDACPEGTYCQAPTSVENDVFVVRDAYCRPHLVRQTATGSGQYVTYVNVPPGRYGAAATLDGEDGPRVTFDVHADGETFVELLTPGSVNP